LQTSETEQLEYYLSSLNELGEVLISADELEKIGSEVLRLTLGTVMASKGAIFIYNTSSAFSFLAGQGTNIKNPFLPPKNIKENLKKYRYGHVLLDKNETWNTGMLKKHNKEIKTKVLLPLFNKDHLLGLLCIGKKIMGEEFSTLDLTIMEIVSSLLTRALYNNMLIKDVKKGKEELNIKLLELETLFDISVAISSVLDIDELTEEVLWRSVGILNASKGMVLLVKDGSPILDPLSTFNWDEKVPLLSKKLEVFKKIQENKKGVRYSEKDNSALQKKLGEKNLIVAPLVAKNKPLGYMILCNKETRKGIEAFKNKDLGLLTSLSNQAAVAMENARLFKEITKEKHFNESVLGSIATGVVTLNIIGEVDSINAAGLKILKTEKEKIIGNHYLFIFEKDEEISELITRSELENNTKSDINLPLTTASEETVVNVSVSPRLGLDGKKQGMVVAIEDITDVSKVKNTFKRYVSKQVVDELLDNEAKLNLGGEQRNVTILFTDIRGFTAMAEKMSPEIVVSTLNEYFSEMIDVVFKYNGTLDKIIGDELMVVYGAPISGDEDTKRAVETAVEMQNKIKRLNKERKKRKKPEIFIGAGINKGMVVSGNIGSRDMMDYTVIGDTVNLAARLCSSAKPGEILVSLSVQENTKDKFDYIKLKPIKVKGKKNKIDLYKVNIVPH